MESEKYLPELIAEKDTLDPCFQHSLRLLDQGKYPKQTIEEIVSIALVKPVWKLFCPDPYLHCLDVFDRLAFR